VPLAAGCVGLRGITTADLAEARAALSGVEIVAATDVDNPLTGLFGATKTFGPQKGIAEERLPELDGLLQAWAEATDRRLALEPGAGAAGGVGFGLLLLGAQRRPGIDLVAEAVGLAEQVGEVDLVITGEGAFDFSSRAGKVPYGVARLAAEAIRPCIALAGQVLVGSREMRALGMDAAYSLVDVVGEEQAYADPAGSLAALAERVARTWSD
jgi:glycerate kinase